MRSFQSLDQREILALAVALEEEHARIYEDFADGLREHFPEQAEKFRELRREEDGHRHRLLDLFRSRFGDHVPLIRRQDVKGFVKRKPIWQKPTLGVKAAHQQAESMELEAQGFYEVSARQATDAGTRQLLGDLAEEERNHANIAGHLADSSRPADDAAREKRLFAL